MYIKFDSEIVIFVQSQLVSTLHVNSVLHRGQIFTFSLVTLITPMYNLHSLLEIKVEDSFFLHRPLFLSLN